MYTALKGTKTGLFYIQEKYRLKYVYTMTTVDRYTQSCYNGFPLMVRGNLTVGKKTGSSASKIEKESWMARWSSCIVSCEDEIGVCGS
jgi:hypothetical protein